MARLAALGVECHEAPVQLGNHCIQRGLRNGGVAPVGVELVLVLFDVLEHIRLQISPCGHVHDLENRHQGEMVVQRVRPGGQFPQATEQLLQPQIGSETLVKRVFVKDHAGGFLEAQAVF